MDSSIMKVNQDKVSKSDNSFIKYKNFFRPAKYLVPAAIFTLLVGSCGPGADAGDGTDVGTTTPSPEDTVDLTTIIDVPSFKAPVELSISWLESGGNYSIFHPSLGDMDGDGDLDIMAGYKDFIMESSLSEYYEDKQGIVYLKNITQADSEPQFKHDTTLTGLPENSIYAIQGNAVGAMIPTIGDIDGDNDLDLVIASNISKGENSLAAVKMYIAKNNTNNFTNTETALGGSTYSQLHMASALTFYDADSDIDLVTGKGNIYMLYTPGEGSSIVERKKVFWTSNDGSGNFTFDSSTGDIVEHTETSNASIFQIPSFADVDNDGDQDMFTVTYSSGAVTFYLNTGTSTAPVFVAQTSAFGVLPDDGIKYFPAFGDMDGDTDIDVIAGTNTGKLFYIENTDIQ